MNMNMGTCSQYRTRYGEGEPRCNIRAFNLKLLYNLLGSRWLPGKKQRGKLDINKNNELKLLGKVRRNQDLLIVDLEWPRW